MIPGIDASVAIGNHYYEQTKILFGQLNCSVKLADVYNHYYTNMPAQFCSLVDKLASFLK